MSENPIHEIQRSLGRIESSVNDMRHALFGNGQPGMTTRLSALEHSHAACRKEHEKEERQKQKIIDWRLSLTATLAAGIITGAIELVKHLTK